MAHQTNLYTNELIRTSDIRQRDAMWDEPQVALLHDGRRMHLQQGPIDLVVEAFGGKGAVMDAYAAAARRFHGLLAELCDELAVLRQPASVDASPLHGPVSRRMYSAVAPYAADHFITPMAAVAGAVADEIMSEMLQAAQLDRAYVNNGGDIAIHLSKDRQFSVGLVDGVRRPSFFGTALISAASGVGGIATSGWQGRSFSLGIADAVTVLAASAAAADAAATIIANAVDLPGHPSVVRCPAVDVQPDSDLGSLMVTRDVGPLSQNEIDIALQLGLARAEEDCGAGLQFGSALHLQGRTCLTRDCGRLISNSSNNPERTFIDA